MIVLHCQSAILCWLFDVGVSDVVHQEFVYIGNNQFISTLSVKASAGHCVAAVPLVLLHGVGTGAALWVLNLTSVATQRTVYAIDMLGFGRSSRVTFSSDPAVAEMEFVESLEAWRCAVHVDTFILVGHCFGGYIATSYALRYPSHVRHLLVADPWGFVEQRPEVNSISSSTDNTVGVRQLPMPLWVKVLALLLQPFNPFSALRIAGSWGMCIENTMYLYALFPLSCAHVHILTGYVTNAQTVCRMKEF